MKTFFKLMLATAAAAVTFAACQRETSPAADGEQTVRFVAESAPTRTAFTTPDGDGQYPVLWTENDTKVKVSMNLASAKDADVTPASDGQSAKFEAQFSTDGVTAPYTFYALSPASAYVSNSSQYKYWSFEIPADQTPGLGTPDEAAQILVGASQDYTSLDEVIGVNFSHVTAYGRLTLTNLDLTGVAVNGISLDFGTPVAGRFFYYIEDTDDHSAGDLVVNGTSGANIINLATSQTREVWFACAPADISGTELKVTVNTASGLYEKTITVPANRRFVSGRIAKFSIDMTGATLQDNKVYELVTDAAELTAGSEVIIANADGDYAIGTTQNNNNRAAAAVTVEDNAITNPSGSVEILAVEAGTSAGTFAFKGQNDLYLVSENGNNRLKSSEEKTALGSFTVTIDAAGATKVIATASDHGDMRFNKSSGIFSCYATSSTTGTPVALYKLVGSGTDEPIFQATLEGANESGLLTVPASATSAVINVISNVDWVIYSDDDVEFSEEEGNSSASVEVTFPANETEEPVTYTINIESDLGEYEFVITQEAFVPAGESVYRKVTSVTAGKKYIIAAYVNGKLLAATPIPSNKNYGYPAGTEVSSTDGVIEARHTDLELSIEATTGGYTIQQADGRYWALKGDYPSVNVYDTVQESYVWTVSGDVTSGLIAVTNVEKNKLMGYDTEHSSYGFYASLTSAHVQPALYEFIEGGVTPPVGEEVWVKTALTAITSSDVFAIVGNNGADYAMSNDNGASAAPAAVSVTVASDGNSLTAAPAANLQWKLTAASGSYTFYPNGDSSKWLYCTANNNGLRVGTGDNKTFSLNSNYLYNDGQARYVGIYSEQGTAKDWRSYTSINNNIKDQTFAFFVKTAGGGEPPVVETVATPTFSPAAGEVAAGTTVTISCATAGATIHYTTDGSTPTASSATGTSVTVNAAMTIKAIAVKEGMNDSEVATAAYTIQSTTPPSGDSYVKVTSITSGKKYIIVGGTGSKAMVPATLSAANRLSSQDVTITSGAIASTTATDALAVTISASGSGYAISYNNVFLVYPGDGTGLKTESTASSTWIVTTASSSTGTFRFTASNAGTRALAFRGGSANTFGAYATSNITGNEYFDIDLYELGGEGGSVNPTVPATVTFTNGTSRSMTAGETFSNPATTNSTATVTYSSSNTAVATVNAAGLITAVSAGTAVITASVAAVEGAFTAGQATCNITVTSAPTGSEVIDLLTASDFDATGSSTYVATAGISKPSGAVYAGNTAKNYEAIQIRSKNNDSGIVSTTSGGYVKSVKIVLNSNTVSAREIQVYGSNSAYTSAADLYGEDAGTLLGSVKMSDGATGTVTVSGSYQYVGIRSKDGAAYLDSVEITWD